MGGTDMFPMKCPTDEDALFDIVETQTMMYVPQKYTARIMSWMEKPLKMLYLAASRQNDSGKRRVGLQGPPRLVPSSRDSS
jgi:hypothetical protein